MHSGTRPTTVLALLAAITALAPNARSQNSDLRAFDGDWLYVEDRTADRPVEKQQPPMSVTFGLRIEEGAAVMLRGKGTRRREERITLDGSVIESADRGTTRRAHGARKDGGFDYTVESVRDSDGQRIMFIRREFRMSPDGLLVRVVVGDPAKMDSLALYRHPEDIELPRPAKAKIADMAWLADAWTGERRSASIEERWTPPRGGAMLGVSRTVRSGKMVAFEYLRIVQRKGGLVYVAQPGGKPPTEFVLTEMDPGRAVFENPRHDSPQRIVYELADDGTLRASIGFINGGRPTVFEFTGS